MMAGSGLSCPDCGSSNVVDDDLYCQSQRVCEDCGSVVSEGRLTTDRAEGTDVAYNQTTAVAKQPCQNQIKGLQRLRAFCRILRLNMEVEELAETFFRQAYSHKSFIRVSLQKKEALVGCCVLVSCRLRNWPIAMGSICCMLETDPGLVGGVYQELVKSLNIEAPSVGITDILAAHSQDYKIGPLHVPEELAENAKDLTKRAVSLVELAGDSWIVTGRRPVPIMMASVYLAWQSLKPTKARLRFSLEKFCQLAKVAKCRPAQKRVGEIKAVLCTLGGEIPWLQAEVTPANVVTVAGDILDNRYVLMRRALRTHEKLLQAEAQTRQTEDSPVTQVDAPDPDRRAPPRQAEQDPGEATAENAQEPSGGGTDSERGDAEADQGSWAAPPNWGKRLLFAPPCVTNPKIRRVEAPAQPDVDGDADISDSEIDTYIRTPQEVREFARAGKVLMETQDDNTASD